MIDNNYHMEIHQLRYFVALSKELNFHKAAKYVGISQPTLSQQIQKLEAELKVNLFERTPQFVRLTSHGKNFLPYALEALEILKQGKNKILTDKKDLTGKLRIAFIPTIGPYLLPRILKTLKRKAPDLSLELSELTTSLLIEGLKLSHFDLGVLALPIDDKALASQKVGEEKFLAAFSKDHHLSKKKSVTIDDLQKEKLLILQEGHCFRDQALEFCAKNSKKMDVQFEGSSLTSVMNLASTGHGVTFIPEIAKPYAQKNLSILRFRSPQPFREIGLIWRNRYELNYSEKYFLKTLQKIFL